MISLLFTKFLLSRWIGGGVVCDASINIQKRLAAYREEARGPPSQRHGQHVVQHVHVLAEPVEGSADRRAVEEADGGRSQHAHQQSRVQRPRRAQCAQVQRQ